MKKKKNKWVKLAIYSRKIWWLYDEARKECLDNSKGICYTCKKKVKLQVDHIKPLGKMPVTLQEFLVWLPKSFCSVDNLQGMCKECHVSKTTKEGKIRRSHVKK